MGQVTAEKGLAYRDTVKRITAVATTGIAYAMLIGDREVIITMTSGVTYTLTLPPVALVAGQVITVSYIEDAATVTDNLTITDAGDDAIFGDITLNATKEQAVLLSTGERWYVLCAGTPASG